jgi:sucrose-6-phosphate hydrolase SacC (GH32 family)
LTGESSRLTLRLLIDRSVVEVFVQDGELAFAAMTLFRPGAPPLVIQEGVVVKSLVVHTLRSIWEVDGGQFFTNQAPAGASR